ncbi:very short patch repair endonuclease [Rhodoferax sp.]|uniref:very short patch repair endonuclease n=1 Tax=Rhodoferax sp. TaxID=50421 RepID=UPI00263645E4|nr:very short patch repair endonuclease [Rhodoferax sp.]MDD2918648.1 very short patch repair endonuclease [Rhodoferax sp.]
MADVVDAATRSRMMAAIRGKDTKPEMLIRRALHARGLRYRLHDPALPGKPDLVFPRYRAVLFVNGCFWHGHDCRYFKIPATRTEFWTEKINANRLRDERQIMLLKKQGWRVMVIWECTVRDRTSFDQLTATVHDWITNNQAPQTGAASIQQVQDVH